MAGDASVANDAVTGRHQMPGQCPGPAAELQYHPATLAHRPQFGQDPRRASVTVATEPFVVNAR